jgi:hypothetical protein
MVASGNIFDMLAGGHLDLIYQGAGSTMCSLSNGTDSIGEGALLPTDDPSYDAADVLRGIPSFTGAVLDPETGVMISCDQAEVGVTQASVSIGRPVEGWTGALRNMDGTDLAFRVAEVMQDRTIGAYRIKLEILKPAGQGRRIKRAGPSGI